MTRGAESYMGFVGVSTGGSSIRKVFPEWADALQLPTRTLVGHDVALDSPAPVYREVVETIRDDRGGSESGQRITVRPGGGGHAAPSELG